jgi:hypothetical protein
MLLIATSAVTAQEPTCDMETRVKVAIALAKAKAALDAEKSKTASDKKDPHIATGPNVFDDYAAAKAEALKKDVPFLIWVNLEPNGRASEFSTAVHVRVKEYKGDRSARLIVATQEGGCMYERTILNTVTSEGIRNAIGPEKVSRQPRERPAYLPDISPTAKGPVSRFSVNVPIVDCGTT